MGVHLGLETSTKIKWVTNSPGDNTFSDHFCFRHESSPGILVGVPPWEVTLGPRGCFSLHVSRDLLL